MESLNKKTTTGISGGLSFASAAAAGANKPAAATIPATTATGPAKNGGATAAGAGAGTGAVASSSPALGSQSSAPSGTTDSKTAAITTSTVTNTNAAAATITTSTSTTTNANNGAIDWVLGMNVKVVTLADEVYEGHVFAYDCLSKSVSAAATPTAYYSPLLGNNSNNNNSSNSNNGNAGSRVKYDIRILKINYIKEVTPLPLPSGGATTTTNSSANHNGQSSITPSSQQSASGDINITNDIYSTVLPAVGYVQLDKIQQREQQAIREAQAAAARIGVGVTSIGQDIFNALHKTLPCRWHDLQIIVMDEVIISPPYETENCKANASSSYVLARVKKVLEGERMRMANGRK